MASELDAARAGAIRVPSTEDPGAFTGQADAALKRDVLAREYHDDQGLALLAGSQEQHPDSFARLPAEQRADVAAWLACREAAGRADDPLPKAVAERYDSTAGEQPIPPSSRDRWALRR